LDRGLQVGVVQLDIQGEDRRLSVTHEAERVLLARAAPGKTGCKRMPERVRLVPVRVFKFARLAELLDCGENAPRVDLVPLRPSGRGWRHEHQRATTRQFLDDGPKLRVEGDVTEP